MRHYLSASLTREEFKVEFRRIRDKFIEKMNEHIAGFPHVEFRACDSTGAPHAWVWDNDKFQMRHFVGTADDARGFAAHMIDQGMHFAFAGVEVPKGLEIWLTTWEEPEVGPVWPPDLAPSFVEVHGGVYFEAANT